MKKTVRLATFASTLLLFVNVVNAGFLDKEEVVPKKNISVIDIAGFYVTIGAGYNWSAATDNQLNDENGNAVLSGQITNLPSIRFSYPGAQVGIGLGTLIDSFYLGGVFNIYTGFGKYQLHNIPFTPSNPAFTAGTWSAQLEAKIYYSFSALLKLGASYENYLFYFQGGAGTGRLFGGSLSVGIIDSYVGNWSVGLGVDYWLNSQYFIGLNYLYTQYQKVYFRSGLRNTQIGQLNFGTQSYIQSVNALMFTVSRKLS